MTSTVGTNKFKRYRDRYRAKGMRLVRLWVPDTAAPGFAREAARQAALLRGAPEEDEALAVIEQAAGPNRSMRSQSRASACSACGAGSGATSSRRAPSKRASQ